MIKHLLSIFTGSPKLITFTLNDRIKPIDRSLTYSEPLEDFLQSKKWGTVVNEGTFLEKNGEISGCDIRVDLTSRANNELSIAQITSFLEEKGMPKGSTLLIEHANKQIRVGRMEGLALYLSKDFASKAGLSSKEAETFVQTLHDNVGHTNLADRSWSSDEEDAAYFYNTSFNEMQVQVKKYLVQYNLAGLARIVQIA